MLGETKITVNVLVYNQGWDANMLLHYGHVRSELIGNFKELFSVNCSYIISNWVLWYNKWCILNTRCIYVIQMEYTWLKIASQIIKLCYFVIQPLTPRRMSGWPYHVITCIVWFFLCRDVKNTKFNQYLPMVLTSLNVSDSIFLKLVMFWIWRHHDMALWRHVDDAWHNCLFLTTATNVNNWADVVNHVTRLRQTGDKENFERWIMG